MCWNVCVMNVEKGDGILVTVYGVSCRRMTDGNKCEGKGVCGNSGREAKKFCVCEKKKQGWNCGVR